MASKRDWLLQQLGITQWTLRRPSVLQGEVAVSLPPETRLLVVAQTLPAPDDPLFATCCVAGADAGANLQPDAGTGGDAA